MWSPLRHPNYYKKFFDFFSPSIRMSGKNIIFDDRKVKKSDFYKNKNSNQDRCIDVDKILVSKTNHMAQIS